MGFRMYQPREHPRSKVWCFRRPIPARLARFGIAAREVKESLHRKDLDEVLIRCAERISITNGLGANSRPVSAALPTN